MKRTSSGYGSRRSTMPSNQVFLWVTFMALAAIGLAVNSPLVPFTYHSYENLTDRLQLLSRAYPNISHVYTIGKSIENRQLWVMVIGRQPKTHVLMRPNIKFIGTIHGDEAPPKEILLHFLEYLLSNYGKNESITRLLDTTLIHVLPLMNPDGAQLAKQGLCEGPGRENANQTDLNRNFPDVFHPAYKPDRQPETDAVMKWIRETRFVLSMSLHVGALLVIIPFDNYEDSVDEYSKLSPTSDNDVFQHLARSYSFEHPYIHEPGDHCDHNFHENTLIDGVINGADWYATNGTMQDYNYVFGSCMEITVELGCCKFPRAAKISHMWLENRDALLSFAYKAQMGVRGVVYEGGNNPATDVAVKINERMPVNVSAHGEFWKILLPSSSYVLEVTRRGRTIWMQNFMVVSGIVTELHINLSSTQPPVIFPSGLTTTKMMKTDEKSRISVGAAVSRSQLCIPQLYTAILLPSVVLVRHVLKC